MNCPKCKTKLSVAHKYCHKCGENLIGQCRCGEKNYNKAMNLCGKRIQEARAEEVKVDKKIKNLLEIFSNTVPLLFFAGLIIPRLLAVWNIVLNPWISLTAAAVLLGIIYGVLLVKKQKIRKNFAASYPEYYAATNKE